ncbi:hypothetical protein IMCC3135_31540 [Granulosicoccus antarcticus IMCC3135]|uniref:Uncharacterized protein n=2 Tax=Granulosicoccus TaxID=437504 RepID=A0A2Z2P0R8_9GAMM|nr:hypothetical protein IMCC3135_31540 [Granulosicoccus antarcticus IMCC3135]
MGTLVVCSGGTALLSHKGSSLHRLSGLVFIVSMLMMGLIVAAGARLESGSISSLGIHANENHAPQGNVPPREAYFVFAALALIAMILDINQRPQDPVASQTKRTS